MLFLFQKDVSRPSLDEKTDISSGIIQLFSLKGWTTAPIQTSSLEVHLGNRRGVEQQRGGEKQDTARVALQMSSGALVCLRAPPTATTVTLSIVHLYYIQYICLRVCSRGEKNNNNNNKIKKNTFTTASFILLLSLPQSLQSGGWRDPSRGSGSQGTSGDVPLHPSHFFLPLRKQRGLSEFRKGIISAGK